MIDLTSFVKTLDGKAVAVFGLARSGIATIQALRAAGAAVYAWDDNQKTQNAAQNAGADWAVLSPDILERCAYLVPAPGVPLHFPAPHPVVQAARTVGVKIIGDIELLHHARHERRVIGITGTNGKSTTTAMIDHIFRSCDVPVSCGGNIGKAVLALKKPPPHGGFVLELSSYQLDLCQDFTPDIAVLLNITPDHLDRHGDMASYINSKAKILRGPGTKIVAADLIKHEAVSAHMSASLPAVPHAHAQNLFYIVHQKPSDETPQYMALVWTEERTIYAQDPDTKSISAVANLDHIISLPGAHNMQNAAAAYAAARIFGLQAVHIEAALQTYPGLAHRQYPVRTIGKVVYINDSKATNAQAASKALSSYDDIYWILGGQMKQAGLKGLEPLMPRVKHAFLIGEAANTFAKFFENCTAVPHDICDTLERAANQAHNMAQNAGSGVVLLSPACASFDQFPSFETRGDMFIEIVQKLC